MADDDLDRDVASAFGALDRIEPPDLTDRIFGGADASAPRVSVRPAGAPRSRSRQHWIAGIAAAIVLFAGGVAVGVLLARDPGSDGPTLLPGSLPTGAGSTSPSSPAATTGSTTPVATTLTAPPTYAPFGTATITPASAAPGQTITVRPAAEIEPVCLDLASVFAQAPDGLTQIGQLAPDGRWFTAIVVNDQTVFTIPGCAVPRSADAVDYVVPAELDPGNYVICLSSSATDTACGTFNVEAPVADPLATALAQLGADVANVPEGAAVLGDATWCGAEERIGVDPQGAQLDEGARRCLLDAHLAAAPAVFVTLFTSTEGDPIVEVYRTRADGTVELFTDATRDAFGSGAWASQSCARLATKFPGGPDGNPPTTFGCRDDDPSPVQPVAEAPPAWFTAREVLPLCGYAVRIVDVDADQRHCFVTSLLERRPGEFAYVDLTGEARVARWFRVTSTGAFELIEQTVTGGTATWQRYACASLDTVDGVEPGWENVPFVDPRWCNAGLDAVPPPTTTTIAPPPTPPPGTIMALAAG